MFYYQRQCKFGEEDSNYINENENKYRFCTLFMLSKHAGGIKYKSNTIRPVIHTKVTLSLNYAS